MKYYLNGVQVCKDMYLETFAISDQFVKTAYEKSDGQLLTVKKDERGRRSGERFDQTARDFIRQHIRLFDGLPLLSENNQTSVSF